MNPRLLGLALALMLASAAAQAVEPRLRAAAVVDADVVTLGDVLDGAASAADAVVARAPEPGQRMILGVPRIYAVARASGLDWRPLHGLDRVIVQRASRRISHADIEDRLLLALADIAPGKNLRVELANRVQEFHLPTDMDAAALDVENLAYDPRNGRFSVTLVAAGGPSRTLRTKVIGRVFEVIEAPVLLQSVRRGEIIGADDIDWIELRADRLPATVITDPGELIGRTPRRTLRPGEPIRAGDVRIPIVVAKGSSVTMTYRTPTMVLAAPGRALEDGAMGETIRVLNSQTKVVVEATVSGSTLVTVAGLGVPPRLDARLAGANRR